MIHFCISSARLSIVPHGELSPFVSAGPPQLLRSSSAGPPQVLRRSSALENKLIFNQLLATMAMRARRNNMFQRLRTDPRPLLPPIPHA